MAMRLGSGCNASSGGSSSASQRVTDQAAPNDAFPLSNRQGKQKMAMERPIRLPNGLVAMELSVRGEKGISMQRREMIERKSGCRWERSVQGMHFSLSGTALQLRHAAELLLNGAKGIKSTKGGKPLPELQVAANDSQAEWVTGKRGETLLELRQKHEGVEFRCFGSTGWRKSE